MYSNHQSQAKHAEYTQLQQAFKDTHKNTERLRSTTTAPTELKKEVMSLTLNPDPKVFHALLPSTYGPMRNCL